MAESGSEGNFFSDVYTSAKELIADRFSSPLIFSYIIAWLLINYKAVITTFTATSEIYPINEKIIDIQNYIHNASYSVPFFDDVVLNCFGWAFVAAILYTFIYPYIDLLITTFTLKRKTDLHNARMDAEKGIKYNHAFVEKIYLKHAEIENDLRRRVDAADIINERLRADIKSLEEGLNEVSNNKSDESTNNETSEPSDVATKLELAEAYIEMDDLHGAKELLNEIIKDGGPNQRAQARAGLKLINSVLIPKGNIKRPKSVKTLSRVQDKILIFMGQNTDKDKEYVTESEIKAELGLSITNVRAAIAVLENSKYIYSLYQNGKHHYKLDSLGLDYYVKKNS